MDFCNYCGYRGDLNCMPRGAGVTSVIKELVLGKLLNDTKHGVFSADPGSFLPNLSHVYTLSPALPPTHTS
jgi:hypothetical protein